MAELNDANFVFQSSLDKEGRDAVLEEVEAMLRDRNNCLEIVDLKAKKEAHRDYIVKTKDGTDISIETKYDSYHYTGNIVLEITGSTKVDNLPDGAVKHQNRPVPVGSDLHIALQKAIREGTLGGKAGLGFLPVDEVFERHVLHYVYYNAKKDGEPVVKQLTLPVMQMRNFVTKNHTRYPYIITVTRAGHNMWATVASLPPMETIRDNMKTQFRKGSYV